MPMRRRLGGTNVPRTDENTVTPAISISPASGVSRPALQRSSVLLPQPLGPNKVSASGYGRRKRSSTFKCICKAKVSYRYICERLERLTVITHREFHNVKFQKLEEALCGVP
jgi:hypothetical protein